MVEAYIIGAGHYVPENIIKNKDFEEKFDTTDEWITQRTGIKERRFADRNINTSDLAILAGEKAIKDAGISNENIDFVIVATYSPDMMFPSTACLVQHGLSLECGAVDIRAACTGFVYALSVAETYVKTGEFENVLVIGADVNSRIIDLTDRRIAVLFGDGAGAVVVSSRVSSSNRANFRIIDSFLRADGNGQDLIISKVGGSKFPISLDAIEKKLHFMQMKGREVYKFATKILPESIKEAMEITGDADKVKFIVPHQANLRIIQASIKKLAIPEEKFIVNLQKYGNTTAATIPIAFDEYLEEAELNKGEIGILVGFGGGLTWGAAVLEVV